ncbi:hypothetical protein P5673_029249 [Acropora cervicornis]|uniref:Uncharacterized protein n=1 Tax=Acropora cervicornis TaxID=6130 RepID=A0AAD9UU92_ACRCE|nr:hypothetical protein P5673_029249 [Acropora cervicornis]
MTNPRTVTSLKKNCARYGIPRTSTWKRVHKVSSIWHYLNRNLCTSLYVLYVPSPSTPVTKNPHSVGSAPCKSGVFNMAAVRRIKRNTSKMSSVMLSDTPKKR